MLYVDTSVLAAYYCPEPLSEYAERKLRSAVQPTISVLTEVELCSAVSKKVREGELARGDGLKIIVQFRTHVENGLYRRIHLSVAHYRLAQDWLNQLRRPLRTLDALHLVVASAVQATVLTADAQMAQCAKGLRLSVQLLSKQHSA